MKYDILLPPTKDVQIQNSHCWHIKKRRELIQLFPIISSNEIICLHPPWLLLFDILYITDTGSGFCSGYYAAALLTGETCGFKPCAWQQNVTKQHTTSSDSNEARCKKNPDEWPCLDRKDTKIFSLTWTLNVFYNPNHTALHCERYDLFKY